MRTKTPKPNLFGRKLVLSLAERKTWEHDRDFYLKQGYPLDIAEQYAYDHYSINKKGLWREYPSI